MDRYGSRREMQELEQAHKALHQSVKRVIQLKNRGKDQEAEAEYTTFEEHSDRVVGLLDRLAAAG